MIPNPSIFLLFDDKHGTYDIVRHYQAAGFTLLQSYWWTAGYLRRKDGSVLLGICF